jgi:D-beta-D-heptose 7-phosphate kinase/D-beta-D-heptose 1-phosphate adenosyltransferase
MGRVLDMADLVRERQLARDAGRRFVFTNGCFDILHRGHVELLKASRALGDLLCVGLNSDGSVRRLKGRRRPLVGQADRAAVLAALQCVDLVTIFDEDTPARLIAAVLPDVLVKGADYSADDIVGREDVERAGGRVVRIPILQGYSTESFFREVANRYRDSLKPDSRVKPDS